MPRAERIEKMGNKKQKGYVPEALKSLAKSLQDWRKDRTCKLGTPAFTVNLKGLEKAIKALPKNDRENIEKFWGLTGGVNHSKKIGILKFYDAAFNEMRRAAMNSIIFLNEIDSLCLYSETTQKRIETLVPKFDKQGMQISDIEAIKYLMAYIIFIDNGPKMSFEKESMEVVKGDDNSTNVYDTFIMLGEMCSDLKDMPDGIIKLRILADLLEYSDFKDWMAMKQSMKMFIDKEDQKCLDGESLECLKNVGQIRKFKERIFPYGAWAVTSVLLLGDPYNEIQLEDFMNEMNKIHKNWSCIGRYKVRKESLRTSKELRTLDVYSIGGLEFTDPDEIRFLYLERNLIAP